MSFLQKAIKKGLIVQSQSNTKNIKQSNGNKPKIYNINETIDPQNFFQTKKTETKKTKETKTEKKMENDGEDKYSPKYPREFDISSIDDSDISSISSISSTDEEIIEGTNSNMNYSGRIYETNKKTMKKKNIRNFLRNSPKNKIYKGMDWIERRHRNNKNN